MSALEVVLGASMCWKQEVEVSTVAVMVVVEETVVVVQVVVEEAVVVVQGVAGDLVYPLESSHVNGGGGGGGE